MAESQQPEHFIYARENDLSKADAVAYVLTDPKGELVQYPFKFPELESHDVRAKIVYTGLCASDHHHGRGKWAGQQTYPCCMGHEVIGYVTAVGSGVTKFKVGDLMGASPQRYFCGNCFHCNKGNTNLCENDWQGLYDPYFGGYATHIQLPERMTIPIPQGMPLNQIPPLLCAGVTVFAPIIRWAKQNPPTQDTKVAVIGIGGLGHLAVMYLNKLGYNVTAFSTQLNRAEEYKKLGAHDTQHSTDPQSLEKNAGKYSYVISTTFFNENNTLEKHVRLCRKAGTFTMVALGNKDDVNTISMSDLIFYQINFQGSIIGSYNDLCEMLEFSKKHSCYPIVEEYPFEKFNDAFNKLEHGRPQFRCVVNVQDWAKKNGFDK